MAEMDDIPHCENIFEGCTPDAKISILLFEMLDPLRVIKGYAEITKKCLEDKGVQGLPPDFEDWMDTIIRKTDFLRRLGEDLAASQNVEDN